VEVSQRVGSTRQTGAPGEPCEDQRVRICEEGSVRRGELLLDRYRLLSCLGVGGFGTVWHAHDELLDRAVAVKRILLPSEEDRERAVREAHATARLAHPAIVALYEATAQEDVFYLISELVQGDTLARLIADDELYDEDVLEIGLALCGALEHAHTRGVIHRDLKPQNVLVPSQATPLTPSRGAPRVAAKLADFGGARLAGDDTLTRAGDVFGTLAYMAPEQSEGEDVGTAADLYSLALVLYEAFSGVNPVRGRTAAATARRIGTRLEALERHRGDLPRELTRALDAALDPDPCSRGTLADLHDELEHAFEHGLRRGLLGRRPRVARATESSGAPTSRDQPQPKDERDLLEARVASPPLGARGRREMGNTSETLDHEPLQRPAQHRLAMPRAIWLGCVLASAVWQAAVGRPGVSLMVLTAGAPLIALPRRAGPGWMAAVLAPVLGLAGLAGAFPALAGQRTGWRARGALGALGFWWLVLAESLLARRLWLGSPSGLPVRGVWESSFGSAATHVVGATLTVDVFLGAFVWGVAAIILPWLVRGRSALLDGVAALAWTAALLAATPLLDRTLLGYAAQPSPRGALVGALLGCALAVGARALRGPV
jgi:eukaryotic-like serine/threonine-protein kinase